MRTFAYLALLGAFPIVTACNGESQTDGPQGDDDDDDDVVVGTPTGPTGDPGPRYMEPVAVGFEFDGILLANGQLAGYNIDGYGYLEPSMILTFADAEFFQLSGDAQDGHYCFAVGTFQPAPIPKPNQIPTHDAATLYSSYEVALSLEGHTCAGMVDPNVWGADGESLWGPFIGARLGYGWGPMTDYLRDAWSEDSLTDFGQGMVATYIAINDAEGNWVGQDWTTGLMFEWDPVAQDLVVDGDGYLSVLDASGTLPGSNLPEGYMRSFAYWYQDFPLMDFSNLTDGAPQ